jgi:hypothetical protein
VDKNDYKNADVGINYSDEWGKKIELSGSYFLIGVIIASTTNPNEIFLQDGTGGTA